MAKKFHFSKLRLHPGLDYTLYNAGQNQLVTRK